jgi:hypothetical protein
LLKQTPTRERKIEGMSVKQRYLMLFYSACGKATPYIQREEQVSNSYWLVCLMQGVNLVSILFLLNYVAPLPGLTKIFFFVIFASPFILNYYVFLKMGKKKIISTVDKLVRDGVIKSKAYVVKYVILSIVFFALSAMLNNEEFQTFLKNAF